MKQWRWYVYVIECQDGLYYTGITWDLALRMDQHQSGKGGKFTALHGFSKLRYYEEFTDIESARKREVQVKDCSRNKKEELWSKAGIDVSL